MTVARRVAGIALASAPFGLALGSIAKADVSATPSRLAVWLAAAALALAALNAWLAFGRPLYLRWRHPQVKFPNVSGYPLVGNLLAVGALIAGFGAMGPSLAALLALVLDMGGLPWFVIGTWRDRSLWNPRQ